MVILSEHRKKEVGQASADAGAGRVGDAVRGAAARLAGGHKKRMMAMRKKERLANKRTQRTCAAIEARE